MSAQVTGAQSLVKSLESAGVDVMFGIPGGAILPAYDPIFDSSIRHILVRHEQGAGHAATGYAQATGRVGVCIATSGPGATNLVTPLADAQMDSVPVVAITGQVASGAIGTDAFQEADIRGITMPVTKHNFLITDPRDIPRAIAEACGRRSCANPTSTSTWRVSPMRPSLTMAIRLDWLGTSGARRTMISTCFLTRSSSTSSRSCGSPRASSGRRASTRSSRSCESCSSNDTCNTPPPFFLKLKQ